MADFARVARHPHPNWSFGTVCVLWLQHGPIGINLNGMSTRDTAIPLSAVYTKPICNDRQSERC